MKRKSRESPYWGEGEGTTFFARALRNMKNIPVLPPKWEILPIEGFRDRLIVYRQKDGFLDSVVEVTSKSKKPENAYLAFEYPDLMGVGLEGMSPFTLEDSQ